jgi:MFS family permease
MTISLLMTLGVLMLANFLILYVKIDLGLSSLHVGALLAVLAVPVLLLGLPLGHAADRWGKSRAVRVSLVISALAMWVIPFCGTVPTFAAVGAILVLSQVAAMPAWLALVSELAPSTGRGGVMGLVATAEGLGATIGPPLGGWLWDINHHYMFYGSAALLTAAAIVAAVTLRAKGH